MVDLSIKVNQEAFLKCAVRCLCKFFSSVPDAPPNHHASSWSDHQSDNYRTKNRTHCIFAACKTVTPSVFGGSRMEY